MQKALKAVLEEGESIRNASEKYGIPKSTLGDRISGRVLPGATSGSASYLSLKEELELATFLCQAAAIGFGHTRAEVIAVVERVLSSRGIKQRVTHGWWQLFIKRYPQLVLRNPATLCCSFEGF